jgi:hypothetical protein
MINSDTPEEVKLRSLQDRAEELECYYAVHELLSGSSRGVEEICRGFLRVISPGLLPDSDFATAISFNCTTFGCVESEAAELVYAEDLLSGQPAVGKLKVYSTRDQRQSASARLSENRVKIIRTVGRMLGRHLADLQINKLIDDQHLACEELADSQSTRKSAISCCRCIDRLLFRIMSQKLLLAIHLGASRYQSSVCPFLRISLPDDSSYESGTLIPTGGIAWCRLEDAGIGVDINSAPTVRDLLFSEQLLTGGRCIIRKK